ncbi:hypothetical protein JHK82_029661 [Glycine max]|nr:hypothetical protein JHK87_029541 [Glycine soja]KAG4987286.1 hypothetical protein JHK85_030269 [Glycine max]KAG4992917.1 hypothetical protein JHK86_029744 [Glycine max]KAG5122924.1 hypothetical protein JHK82_029661 [Glycine max]KAG5144334.1 hypothetical protein JHK84_029877 [Glycine max]
MNTTTRTYSYYLLKFIDEGITDEIEVARAALLPPACSSSSHLTLTLVSSSIIIALASILSWLQDLGKPEPEEIEMILCQVKDHFCDLMMEQHCNYLILSILEARRLDSAGVSLDPRAEICSFFRCEADHPQIE